MLWRCFSSSEADQFVTAGSDVELLPTTRKDSNQGAQESKLTTKSFSEFAWTALKDMSLPQALESSQSYLQSQLRNYSLQPPPSLSPSFNEKHESNKNGEDSVNVVFPLTSPSPPVWNQSKHHRKNKHSSRRHQSFDSRSRSDSTSSNNSLPKSLVDRVLDEYDKQATMESVPETTEDGFRALSHRAMSSSRAHKHREAYEEENSDERRLKKMTTDDGMKQLAGDCMRAGARKKSFASESCDGEHEGTDVESEEGCVRRYETYKAENQRMLNQLNQDIFQSNVTPCFTSPASKQ